MKTKKKTNTNESSNCYYSAKVYVRKETTLTDDGEIKQSSMFLFKYPLREDIRVYDTDKLVDVVFLLLSLKQQELENYNICDIIIFKNDKLHLHYQFDLTSTGENSKHTYYNR